MSSGSLLWRGKCRRAVIVARRHSFCGHFPLRKSWALTDQTPFSFNIIIHKNNILWMRYCTKNIWFHTHSCIYRIKEEMVKDSFLRATFSYFPQFLHTKQQSPQLKKTHFCSLFHLTLFLQKQLSETVLTFPAKQFQNLSSGNFFTELARRTIAFLVKKGGKIGFFCTLCKKWEGNIRTPCALKSQSGIIGRSAPYYSVWNLTASGTCLKRILMLSEKSFRKTLWKRSDCSHQTLCFSLESKYGGI